MATVVIFLHLFVLSGQVSADEAEETGSEDFFEMSLEELMDVEVTTPGRKIQSADKAPSNITVITEQEITDSGAQTLAELLERLPGVYVPTQPQGEESLFIRGIGERYNNKTLLLFDGYPLRNLYYSTHQLNATIPLANIKQIEVVRGPGSSLYGTNAFGGTINIITKKGGDIDGTEIGVGIGSRGSQQGHVLWGKQGKEGWLTFLARYLDDDISSVDRDEAGDPSGKKRYAKNNAFHITGTYKEIDFQVGYYRMKLPDFMEPITSMDDETQESTFFRLGYTTDLTDRLSMRARTYANLYRSEGEKLSYSGGLLEELKKTSRESHVFGIDIQWRYEVSQNNDLVFGVTHEFERIRHSWSKKWKSDPLGSPLVFDEISGWISNNQTLPPGSVDNQNTGVYAEDEIRLIPDVLTLTVGARYDKYQATCGRLSPRAALVWEPRKGTVVKGLYGEAFRSPSYRELYKDDGNPDLKPEVIKTTELNVSHYLTNNHRLEASLYHCEVTDFIKTVDDSYANQNRRTYRGIELGLKGQFPAYDLRYFVNYTNLDASQESTGDIGGIPEEMFNAGLTYEGLKYVSVSPYLQYIGKRNRPSDYQTDDDIDPANKRDNLGSYPLFNIALRTTKALHPDVEVAFIVKNLFDEKYFTIGEKSYKYDVQRPGRTLWLTMTYSF